MKLDIFAARLIEAHTLATVVLCVAFLAMRLVRQPARRITTVRTVFVALAAIGAISLLRDRAAVVEHAVAPTSGGSEECTTVLCCPSDLKDRVPSSTASISASESGSPPDSIAKFFLAGSVSVAAWLALGTIAAIGLRARLRPAGERFEAILSRAVGPGGQAPQLWLDDCLGQPIAFGLIHPSIVLPARFANDEPESRVEAAIVHERAHLCNGDLTWLAVSRALLLLFFAHPLYHMLRRRVRLDQEAVADAEAARASGRIAYAEALLSWARPERRATPRLMAALGLCERPSMLRVRVALLLNGDFRVESRSPVRWRLGVGLAAALLVAVLAASAARIAMPVHDCGNCTEHARVVTPLASSE